jgi:hypothetical protein
MKLHIMMTNYKSIRKVERIERPHRFRRLWVGLLIFALFFLSVFVNRPDTIPSDGETSTDPAVETELTTDIDGDSPEDSFTAVHQIAALHFLSLDAG